MSGCHLGLLLPGGKHRGPIEQVHYLVGDSVPSLFIMVLMSFYKWREIVIRGEMSSVSWEIFSCLDKGVLHLSTSPLLYLLLNDAPKILK